ncbi:Enamine deaminase RidA, house cleaning of reactive enamine intermediates, YjgF/YER057c/UK114 family [Geopseudomonas sagittaria]|uniref:Enamine deaminase RidA, house cleaning of reactive enamine intermediates, YjgF/YER057c/UK114 family n=2 Tax=Geopseudomonas sagittaria TaxID=1135990 RepID=A0A1I5XHA7_9GAMM|nr:Enamine deaminase RidA, house cleaning of reactive enamine intermediates, YjgF/YER057c/UK114 family [Pseudomonas sagittaria]
MNKLMQNVLTGAALTGALLATQANAADAVIRHKIPNSSFPIALAVEVPATATVVNLSGSVPVTIDAKAPADSLAAYGDTEAQTVSVFKTIDKTLQSLGLNMGDVVKMQVFLVGDPTKGGKMDFAGFMKGYGQFFGTEAQPKLPARSVMQVAGLVNPAWLVEIEVTAVRP